MTDRESRERRGDNFKMPVEWPVLFPCHSNPEQLPYACHALIGFQSRGM
jgi:hypothetical protein